jgi:DNA polymerase I-like protein with 3'-5' exonuclease and polymerase domains
LSLENLKLTRVTSLEDVARMMEWLGERRDFLAVDTECSGLNRGKDIIRLIQFGDHTQGWALEYADWRGVAKKIFEEYDRPIVCHNLSYDSSMLKKDGLIIPQKLAHDSMILAHLKNPSGRMDLKGACTVYVDKRAAIGRGLLEQFFAGGGWSWATVPVDAPAYWTYGALDTCLTSMLASKLYPEIISKYREAYELELGVIHCLRDAELAGMLTDEDYIRRAKFQLSQDLSVLRPQIPCEPNSDKQVVEYLLGIGVPLFMRTEKGNLSTDKEVMRYFADDYPVCALISEYKSKHRMLHAYLEKFEDLAVDGVLRASCRPVAAKTGRMSVTDPPLQTLPRGRLVRDAIISRPGTRFVMADFAGMELRALASEANEISMLETLNGGGDLHNFVATELYGANFTKPQRQIVKNGQFSLIYGAGVEKFAVTAKIPVAQAKEFFDRYNVMFPRVAQYMQDNVNEVMERAGGRSGKGWVELIDGRHLVVPGDKAYISTNYKIQGGCAVVLKRKIAELDAAGLGDFFRLPVHDELLLEVPERDVEEAKHILAEVMPDRYSFRGVTLTTDQDCVNRWGQHYRGPDYPKYVETEDPEWLEAA